MFQEYRAKQLFKLTGIIHVWAEFKLATCLEVIYNEAGVYLGNMSQWKGVGGYDRPVLVDICRRGCLPAWLRWWRIGSW